MFATIAAFMYCPNCGQQQVSGEMRFCSRCGLALTGLAEWLASNGYPEIKEAHVGYWYRNRHQKWVRHQMWKQIQSGEKSEMKG